MVERLNPNHITLVRILLLPVPCLFLLLDFLGAKMLALISLIFLALTDYFDGIIARRYKKISSLGAKLDPIADKIFVITIFLLFYYLKYFSFLPVFLIVLREVLISYLRTHFYEKLKVSLLSKIKTLSQMLTIIFVIFLEVLNMGENLAFKDYLIWLVVLLSYFSGLWYFVKVYRKIFEFTKRDYINFIKGFIKEVLCPLLVVAVFPLTYKLFWLTLLLIGLYFLKSLEGNPEEEFRSYIFWYLILIGIIVLEVVVFRKVQISLIFWTIWMILSQRVLNRIKAALISFFSYQGKV